MTSADWTSSLLAVAVAWLAGENHRSRRARWAALEDRAAMLENEREERDRRAVADERLRIARDLHDIVSHAMSVIAVQAAAGHHLLDRDPEAARRALSNVETASRGALVEMRRMLGVLRDDDDTPGSRAPAPSLSKLGDLVARVRDAGLGVSLTIGDDLPELPEDLFAGRGGSLQEEADQHPPHLQRRRFGSAAGRAVQDRLRLRAAAAAAERVTPRLSPARIP